MIPPREIFARYVQQRRGQPLRGFDGELLPHLARYTPHHTGREGIILFAGLERADLDVTIAAQIAFFTARRLDFEWKVYDFDRPDDLARALAARGFTPGEREAFMVYPTASHRSRPPRPGVRIERVTSAAGIRTIAELQSEIWGEDLAWLERSLTEGLENGVLLLAWAGDRPVGTGWIEFPSESDFAELHGGAVLPAWRGQGIYSALFDHRADEARARSVPYLAVDAAPMSRPILQRRGFHHVCDTTPLRWRVGVT